MDIYSIVFLAVGLAMDALSVATATGFGMKSLNFRQASKMSINFGAFHIIMPIAGWFVGSTIVWLIASFDHWIAFLLLAFVGGKMIHGAFDSEARIETSKVLDNLNLLFLSIAVSIDDIAAGLSLYLENVPILMPAIITGTVTSAFTFLGVVLGNRTGQHVGKWAQLIGGFVLITIGFRIVIRHIL